MHEPLDSFTSVWLRRAQVLRGNKGARRTRLDSAAAAVQQATRQRRGEERRGTRTRDDTHTSTRAQHRTRTEKRRRYTARETSRGSLTCARSPIAMSSLPMEVDSCITPPTSSMLSSTPAASYWCPVGWSDLPIDLIECIIGFLPLRFLSSSFLPVCLEWRDGLRAVAPRRVRLTQKICDRLHQLGQASIDIRRHVTSLCTTGALMPESFAPIRRLPRLTHLHCLFDCGEDDEDAWEMMERRRFEFPPQLRTLILTVAMMMDDDATPKWTQLERVLEDIAQVSTLTKLDVTLEVECSFALIPLRTMRQLTRLRESLTRLTISRREIDDDTVTGVLSRGHVDLLRSLHQLKFISLCGVADWSAQSLEWIVEEPRMMHLEGMDLGEAIISSELATVLARFTWLSHLSVCLEGSAGFLASLTRLTSIEVICSAHGDPTVLLAALSHCTRIKRLRLLHPDITSVHLTALLTAMPLLAEFILSSMDTLTSLAFASSVGHLARTLKVLTLCMCTELPPDEVRHLRSLTALRQLLLDRSFNAPLDDDVIASMSAMTPGSHTFECDVWPHLIRFEHTPRESRTELMTIRKGVGSSSRRSP